MRTVINMTDKTIILNIEDERNLRQCITGGTIYEYIDGNKNRILLNTKNILSVEFGAVKGQTSSLIHNPIETISPEELRERQLAMQPDIPKFEAKAKAMEDMKKKEDAAKDSVHKQIKSALVVD